MFLSTRSCCTCFCISRISVCKDAMETRFGLQVGYNFEINQLGENKRQYGTSSFLPSFLSDHSFVLSFSLYFSLSFIFLPFFLLSDILLFPFLGKIYTPTKFHAAISMCLLRSRTFIRRSYLNHTLQTLH